jgi:type VI secretion system Hcp family effector
MALAYVKIESPTIDGDSKDQNHQKWIEVNDIIHEIRWNDEVKAAGAGGRLNGEPSHPGVVIKKAIDTSSPMLRQRCASGERLGKVVVDVVNLAGTGVVAHQFELAPAFVSWVKVESEGGQPHELVQFRYGTIKWKHTSQDAKGQKAGESEGSWLLGENTPL